MTNVKALRRLCWLPLLATPASRSFASWAAPSADDSITLDSSVSSVDEIDSDPNPLGHVFSPLDIIFDQTARNELNSVKTTSPGQQVLTDYLKSAGNDNKVALTLRGNKGGHPSQQINQDSSVIVSPFMAQATDADTMEGAEVPRMLLGVFDGHGKHGEKTSSHAAKSIPELLHQKLQKIPNYENDDDAVKAAIREAFLEVDKSDPTGGKGGATASIIVQLGHKLFVANAGDSRSFIGLRLPTTSGLPTLTLAYVSREDKPDVPEEYKRIMASGGYVHIPSNPQQDVPRAYYVNPQGHAVWGVAMSRSIGDWDVKGVTAEPVVDVLNIATLIDSAIANLTEAEKPASLDPLDAQLVAVSATDGMLDYIKPQDIAHVMTAAFFKDENMPHPFVAAEYLVFQSAKGWEHEMSGQYRDDISIAASKILVNQALLDHGKAHDEL
eukprot:Nitzschia sp. Nitz4//scaffold10_size219509//171867//173186//NITZ4_001452-RA/size219509-processed-gene-0.289-mRNA-1//1//CDS//3329532992//1783//frame0